MPPDLMSLVVGQLPTLTLAPLLYLALVTVVVVTAVFSREPSRRRVALAVLRLLIPRQNPPEPAQRSPSEHRPNPCSRTAVGSADIACTVLDGVRVAAPAAGAAPASPSSEAYRSS